MGQGNQAGGWSTDIVGSEMMGPMVGRIDWIQGVRDYGDGQRGLNWICQGGSRNKKGKQNLTLNPIILPLTETLSFSPLSLIGQDSGGYMVSIQPTHPCTQRIFIEHLLYA